MEEKTMTLKECLEYCINEGTLQEDETVIVYDDSTKMEVSYRYLQAAPYKKLLQKIVAYYSIERTMFGFQTYAFYLRLWN